VEHPYGDNIEPMAPGCYHQHYRLNGGPLVAVGVVDILPKGLSSVYLFYDVSQCNVTFRTSFSICWNWNKPLNSTHASLFSSFSQPGFAKLIPMGKYAIMREIEWTQKAKLPCYYLGYYIESCLKMRYKGDYRPSELLCPETCEWIDAEEAKATIQRLSPVHNCCRLAPPSAGITTNTNTNTTTNNHSMTLSNTTTASMVAREIPIDVGIGNSITVDMLQEQGQDIVRPLLEEFVQEAGPDIVTKCTIAFC
jgi:hypothetical protein